MKFEELNFHNCYEILENLRNIDPAGSRTTLEASEARTRLARKYAITEKEIIKFCKLSHKHYSESGLKIAYREHCKEDIKDLLQEFLSSIKQDTLNKLAFITGYVFWENECIRKAVPGKNLEKYSQSKRDEIFKFFD